MVQLAIGQNGRRCSSKRSSCLPTIPESAKIVVMVVKAGFGDMTPSPTTPVKPETVQNEAFLKALLRKVWVFKCSVKSQLGETVQNTKLGTRKDEEK